MAHLPHLSVSIPEQKLVLNEQNGTTREFTISTSKFGIGTAEGSNHTPTGNFIVSEKHGGGAAPGTSFKGRVAEGLCDFNCESDHDFVLTRILRLSGLDTGNTNTYDRYIYIHGTNQESLIGTPASHGCIRMKNEDIVTLFDLVPVGATLTITDQDNS